MEQFQRSLSEDTIEYFVYAFPQKHRIGSASHVTISKTLKDVKAAASKLVEQHLRGYIWQREAFGLETKLKSAGSDASGKVIMAPSCFAQIRLTEYNKAAATGHLRGRTNFGDAIEDEWLIVWLLRQLSLQFPSVWVRVTDSSGEFLLVEAANVLPGWLDPDIAEHRVWINKGELRLIPATPSKNEGVQQADTAGSLSIDDVRKYIFDERPTLHPHLVEKEAFHRLQTYPAQIQRNQHHALLIVPRKLAYLLNEKPGCVSAAVDAFYVRDPIAMKPLMAPNPDALIFPPSDFVTMRVKLTRVGFAQIRSQRFEEPRAWQDAEKGYDDARHRQRAEDGIKICAGFELLLGDPQRQDERIVREIKSILEDLNSGDATLPEDKEVQNWGLDADDERWMDIDFQDFDDELSGRKAKESSDSDSGAPGSKGAGFGDKGAQENLRKMVQRFEDFMNDDTMDAYDIDDDDDDKDSETDGSDSDAGDASAPFTEDDFTKMMREMMGMPEDVMREIMTGKLDEDGLREFAAENSSRLSEKAKGKAAEKGRETESGPDRSVTVAADGGQEGDEDDEEEIRQLTAAMEAELRSSGALDIPDARQEKSSGRIKSRAAHGDVAAGPGGEEESSDDGADELLDADYNLVANMLESFKGQGGAPGPGGNLMGMLGLRMPRDEEASEDEEGKNVGAERDGRNEGPSASVSISNHRDKT